MRASGRRVGDPASAHHVKVVLVVAEQLEVLETLAAREQVVGDVRDVVRLVVRRVDLEQVHAPVDLLVEADCLHHPLNQGHTPRGDGSDAIRDLVAGARATQHRATVVRAVLVLSL